MHCTIRCIRDDVLFEAWKRVKANKGSSGVEGIRIEDIEADKTMVSIRVLYGNVLTISEPGTSQGSVISPLLANIYLNTLDRLWEKYGLTHGILVRYADDTVIICKNKKSANHALNLLQYIMTKLDLKLHPVKTKIVSMWNGKENLTFLECTTEE